MYIHVGGSQTISVTCTVGLVCGGERGWGLEACNGWCGNLGLSKYSASGPDNKNKFWST